MWPKSADRRSRPGRTQIRENNVARMLLACLDRLRWRDDVQLLLKFLRGQLAPRIERQGTDICLCTLAVDRHCGKVSPVEYFVQIGLQQGV